VFDLDAGQRGLSEKKGELRSTAFSWSFSRAGVSAGSWGCGIAFMERVPAFDFRVLSGGWQQAGRRGLPSSGCGSRTPMVSASSLKYFLATA
jgi:hypothetical protein